ncbi:hypothetical protein BDM02DRAFT_3132684 [Thelephora ganbajun]|uniref:Uncharacterized protein n=1 Tax=Thelephora ganbajun TaxID=370292 RepID=A0ACB6Z0F7_THEGA|nr:hypothetical protein BDM02DRAFT_3132684 [Thelephora ganbajun]
MCGLFLVLSLQESGRDSVEVVAQKHLRHLNLTAAWSDVCVTYTLFMDIRRVNILVNEDWWVCIADFSLTIIAGIRTHADTASSQALLFSNDTLTPLTSGGAN